MKKVFTLVASFMLVAAAFAQGGHGNPRGGSYDNNNDVVYNNGPQRNDYGRGYYSFSIRERDQEIASINREYDRKIQQAKFKMFMSPYRRAGLIRQLEAQRNNEIRLVYAKFNSPKNVFGDNRRGHDNRNDGRGRKY